MENCKECAHAAVCRFIDSYNKINMIIKDEIDNFTTDYNSSFIDVKVNCKLFQRIEQRRENQGWNKKTSPTTKTNETFKFEDQIFQSIIHQ